MFSKFCSIADMLPIFLMKWEILEFLAGFCFSWNEMYTSYTLEAEHHLPVVDENGNLQALYSRYSMAEVHTDLI